MALAAATPVPRPAAVLGPVATLQLGDAAATFLFQLANSALLGPLVVAGFALAMNRVLTHPAVTATPVLRHALPRRDPTAQVAISAALGTWFYLLVVALATGRVVVVPALP